MKLANEIAREAKRAFAWTNADGYSDKELEETMLDLESIIAAKLEPVREALELAVHDHVRNIFADTLLKSLEKGNRWFGTQGWVVCLKRQAKRLQQAKAALDILSEEE